LYLRVESSKHLRHTGFVLVAAISAPHHRQGIAGAISRTRLAPETGTPPLRRSPPPRSARDPRAVAFAGVRGAVADDLRRRDAKPRWPRRALQGGEFSAR